MNAELIFASPRIIKNVVKNLMQFHIYDFSECTVLTLEKNGLFKPYPDLQDY